MAAKRLIVVVESTAAMGPYWETILRDYLDKIIRCFGENDSTVQNSCSNVEFALVSYNTHGCYSGCLVQRTGWTRDPDVFFMWLSSIPFSGGGFNDAVIAEGLAEALVMFPNSQSGDPNQQNVDMHQHCILVAASNPYPLQTPIYVPQLQNLEQSETIDSFPGNRLYDAEAVAKAFPQGNRNSKAADPPVLAKTPHFLILISEGFREAQGALKVGESCSKMAPCNANSSAYISSHMNNKEYVVFQAMNPYGFRGHLEDKKKLLLQRLLFWINRELEIVALLQFLFGK
ncbi:hypothetical protein GLYMA_02G098500v4 [Glycine max]|uniref:Mediator of RNA polymerase II transcription subunit 25 n=1 Tax=Glycine max TaxID=3847 RepID=A0A0R0L1R0_SOYBN|nr:mediator of RNA polymerase II transcription subunit 25 isoform X2 [Glycine max]XP_028201640.1 mediator of RNA polymerase II transcription subunit 25-like isoform X2 [Glycine soja]KAH1059603.1 hypothetical protein GYH30_003553 [Glycine max]KAH1059608.1 hypothetical protein GYH30_003553 [Glycine max]KRH70579.1 hypothetical protein GLYMA_02G098500v4 [Glycine max]KRH70580.1 hypothetical protein GLYMA_02G098500v4 [Glycine max]|eukprot:XP_014621671.1 mediator of RNA polymerase II transcription subunit 25 isoform X2 [Glycine max]